MSKKINFKGVSTSTWVRLVSLFLVLVNLGATVFLDIQLIPFEDKEIYEFISTVATFIVTFISAWKNNSLTVEAQTADIVLKSGRGVK